MPPTIAPARLDAGLRATLPARLHAAALHCAASSVVGVGVAALLLLWAYPDPFVHAAAGFKVLGLIVAVDVLLGPLLTAVAFDPRKARSVWLKDLCVIVVLQLAALTYGLHSAALGRPVYAVFVVDRFELMTAAEIDADEVGRARPEFRELSWNGPRLAAARLPEGAEERQQLLLAATAGIDLRHLVSRYEPFSGLRAAALAKARPIDALSRYNAESQIADALARAGVTDAARVRWLPLQGKHEDQVALLDARSGDVVGFVRLQPW